MYVDQPACFSAYHYYLSGGSYDTEEIFVFPRETQVLYEVYLWAGREIAREQQVREESQKWLQAFHRNFPPSPEGIRKRVLLGTFTEACDGPEGIGARSRKSSKQRSAKGLGPLALRSLREAY